MYHCHIQFYLSGHPCRVSDIIKEILPLEHFTHGFLESDKPEEALAAEADVILADLQDMDVKEALQTLTAIKKKDAEMILLADKEQIMLLADNLSDIKDIWTLPMSDEEIKFRFQRWQQTYKMSKDFWQTSQYLEATINNIPNLIWYKDKEGIHKKVNNSFCRTVNKTKQQVEGRDHCYIWDVDPDDPEMDGYACMESELEVINKKRTCISEEVIKTGDGIRLLTTYKSPLYDFDGSVMGTVGVAIDITQERAYEEEIMTKNHTLETLFTTMDCGVMCHTVDGSRIISINRAALKILGYKSQEELMATGFNMIAPSVVEEDRERLRECIRTLKKEGDSVSVEYRVEHKSGEILYIVGNIKLLKENGEFFYQRFLLDCTTQKLQEKKKQKEKEKRQMELVHALSIDFNLVCFFDLETGKGSTLKMDDRYAQILNSAFTGEISLQESMEHYIQTFVYKEDREMMRQACSAKHLKSELSEKNLYYVSYRLYRDNEMQYFQMKAVRPGAWDESQGIVIGFRSVDEETRNEMEKKSLLEEALLQANKANKAKSVFLSNMSHDIRTPMNAIVGFTSLAITHIGHREQVEEYLKKIMSSGNHLLSLINDVLDMSRIESGKMQLEEKPCSLPEILNDLRNILQADVNAKKIKLNIEAVRLEHEEIYCDKLRLNQVFLNLLSNAVKYTNAGGSVSLGILEKPGLSENCAEYEFSIKDTGIGMSEDFVSHIFEPFERERNSTISRIQGTGLGMAITKNIVDMMHGSIEVKSEQGKGTEVRVSFIFHLAFGKKLQAIPEFKNCRALVADGNINNCNTIAAMLTRLGMRAEQALSGDEAVQKTRRAAQDNDVYGVYVIDWQIIDMTNLELIQKLRKETGETAVIIAMAANDWSEAEEEAKAAGVTAFCNKPLFFSELWNCLSKMAGNSETDPAKRNRESVKLGTGHILLAEDIDLNQEIAVAILGEAGFSVDVAENGQIAVDMIKESQPGYYQLVLMDIQMPVMNGYEATRKIRKLENPELSSIPILAMSANAFEEDRQEALRCGMNGHIAKPIDVDNLLETLNEILS